MKLEAKQRLQLTAENLGTLTENLAVTLLTQATGIPDKDNANDEKVFYKPVESDSYWTAFTRTKKFKLAEITANLGAPVITAPKITSTLWSVKNGKYVVLLSRDGTVSVLNSSNKFRTLSLLFKQLKDKAKYKSYEIDPKSKTIRFQPYVGGKNTKALLSPVIQKLADTFGFKGWAVDVQTSHWTT
jgi:hypothetical protein